MIDIDCHLIPDIDDGPNTWEQSLKMVRISHNDGIKCTYSTPHWIQGTVWQPYPERVKDNVAELNDRIKTLGIDYKVFAGMEIGITENLPELVESKKVLTLGDTQFVLVETPYMSLPLGFKEILFNLKLQGIVPVLAHPEKNMEFQQNPEMMLDYTDSGIWTQITASSLSGAFGGGAKKCALELVRLGCVNALGSDGHSENERPPIMSHGYQVLENIIGSEKVGALTSKLNDIFGH